VLLTQLVASTTAGAATDSVRWYFSSDLNYHTTQDSIRSNATLGSDPRPDDLVEREITVQDTLSYSLAIGFNLKSWLALQLDLGFFRGEVGPIDVFLTDRFPVATDPSNPSNLNAVRNRQTTIPVAAGRLTEIPVFLSGVSNFRRDKPFRPYLAVGFGEVFAELDEVDDVEDLNARLRSLRIRAVLNEQGQEITPPEYDGLKDAGRVPLTNPVFVRVDNGLAFRVSAGLEYAVNERLSVVSALTFVSTDAQIIIDLAGQDQVDFRIYSEELFRKDGSLKIFNSAGLAPNPLVDPSDPSKGRLKCPAGTIGDFDKDGRGGDVCYFNDPLSAVDDPVGVLLVQGGTITLGGFSAQIGIRFYF